MTDIKISNDSIEAGVDRLPKLRRDSYSNFGSTYTVEDNYVVKVKYRGFLSLIWMLFKQNWQLKKRSCFARYDIILPLRWFK